MEVLLPLLVGVLVGVVVGALGAGGGILAVPILVYVLHQEPHAATASSLVIVGVTALVGLRDHLRARTVDWGPALVFGSAAVLGSLAGTWLSLGIPARTLMLSLAALLSVAGVAMGVRAVRDRRREGASGVVSPTAPLALDAGTLLRTGAGGLVTGVLTGVFGVGGGFITVPMLVLALRMPIRRAAGASLVAMVLASTAGLLGRLGASVPLDWTLTLLFTLGSSLGGLVGGPLTRRVRPSTLTAVFAALLLGVAAFTLAQTLA